MDIQELCSEDSDIKMESDIDSEDANSSDPNIDINSCFEEVASMSNIYSEKGLTSDVDSSSSDDDNVSEDLLEERLLNEKMRAAEEFARELKLRNRPKIDLKSVLDRNSSDPNIDINSSFEEVASMSNTRLEKGLTSDVGSSSSDDDNGSEDVLLNEKNRAAEEFARELKFRSRPRIDLSVLDTASANDGNESDDEEKVLDEKIRAAEERCRELKFGNQTNIDIESELGNASASDAEESLEDLLEEQMLHEKMRAAEEFGRKLKLQNQTNINLQCVTSVSGACNSKSVEGNLDVHKFLGYNRKDFYEKSKEEQLDMVNKALTSNLYMQAFLSKWEKSVEEVLEKNLNLQECLIESIRPKNKGPSKVVRQWNTYTSTVFGMAYFKEKDKKISCPPNADTKLRIERGHPLTIDRNDTGKWTQKETDLLQSCVQASLRDKITTNLYNERDEIKKANEDKSKAKSCKTRNQIDKINRKIKKVKAMSLKELLSEQDIDDGYDWQAISLNTFRGFRSPGECQSYWKLCLDPTLNHSSWDKEEDDKLLELAEQYSFQDWDKIAIELGSNRSAYECCVHFERELDRNVRSSGKWTTEEDDKLIEAVNTFRVGNHIPWTKISFAFTQRSVPQLRARWIESLAPHRKKGKFTPEEDKLIFESVEKHGCSFVGVESMFPNRTASQIRARFQRKKGKLQAKGRWTLEEDKLLMELVDRIGIPKWKEISEHFITRTRTQVRQRYNAIQVFLDRYPTLGIDDMIRRSKKSKNDASEITSKCETIVSKNDASEITSKCETIVSKNDASEITSKCETIVSNSESAGANCETKIEVKDTDKIPKDLPRKERNRRKRKTVIESSSIDDGKPSKNMRRSCSTDNTNRIANILKLLKRKRETKGLSPAGRKLTSYFQETYPMQALVGKKNWAETDISSEAQVIFDLSHILKVDFSYIDDRKRLKSVSPYMLRQIVRKLIENHSDNLLRLNPVNTDQTDLDFLPQTSQTHSDVIGVDDATSHIDCPPMPVEETLCSGLFLDDFTDEDQHQDIQPLKNNNMQNPSENIVSVFDSKVNKKREFMEFPYLIPPNVATAVGYRSLLLIERKLKNIVSGDTEDNDEALPPDYSSCEFRFKDEDKMPANNQFDMGKCVRFTRDEAMHMFRERLKILFAVPIVMGDCAGRYFDASHLPIYKKDGIQNRMKRRTNTHLYEDLHKSKLTHKSHLNQIPDESETDYGDCTDTEDTCGVYSMPSLDSCQASTSSSTEHCTPSSSNITEICNPSTSNIPNCNPSTSKFFDNSKPSTSSNMRKSSSSHVKKEYPSRRQTRSKKP